jgi:hypothetical protein
MSEIQRVAVRQNSEPQGVRRLTMVALTVTAVLAGWTLLAVAPALAGQARVLTGSFGTATSTSADPYPLTGLVGRDAVDLETHDVYVADQANNRVEKFDAGGQLILMFGSGVDRTTGGNVCTVASGDVCQAGVASSSPGAFARPQAIVVDNSGVFGQQGDVYVGDLDSGLISKFNAEGGVISSWGDNGEGHAKDGPPNGQLNGANATGGVRGPFNEVTEAFGVETGGIEGIALDPSGNLWVRANVHDVFEFHPNSHFATAWETGSEPGGPGLAVDSEDNVYTGQNLTKYNAEGAIIGDVQVEASFFDRGLGLDPVSNDLYVVQGQFAGPSSLARYAASCNSRLVEGVHHPCSAAESFGAKQMHSEGQAGLAIDPSSSAAPLYVSEREATSDGVTYPARVLVFSVETVPDVVTDQATNLTASSATLTGSVNPSGVELEAGLQGCRFEWGPRSSGAGQTYSHTEPCDKTAAQIGAGSSPVEVHAHISGLQQGQTYHFRLVAGNHNQVNGLIDEPSLGADLAFGPPVIASASAIAVGSSDATVQAEVNPNNVDTRIRAEYGTEAGVYPNSTAEVDLGAGGVQQLASFQFAGLSPGSTYHYRFVAENALGEGTEAISSPDHSFVTQGASTGFAGLDGRTWELVSPANKHGAEPLSISEEGVVEAAVTGDAATFIATTATEAEPEGSANGIQVLSHRTPTGWVSSDIAAAHDESTGTSVGQGPEYSFFSSDLARALLQPFGKFVPELSPEASEQTPYLRTNFASGQPEAPCASSCYRPLVTGAAGYEDVPAETVFAPTCAKVRTCGPRFVGATPDLSHILMNSQVPLIEGAPAGRVGSDEGALYEWTDGKLSLVSVLPNERPAAAGELGLQNRVTRNAISPDGSRVVWSNGAGLYVRDLAKAQTVQVDAAHSGPGTPMFQTASSDVSKVLFTVEGDLRECDIVESEGSLACDESDLTSAVSGEEPRVLGLIDGASEDGSYVYFAADGVLQNESVPVAGAQPGRCATSSVGSTCNLYVRHDGKVKLVAELSGEDGSDWDGAGGANLAALTARVSPDGRWFAFVSDRSLTGYDNRDVVTGNPDEEVYLYDAEAGGGEGSLVCASCNPTGARPHGVEYGRLGVLAHGRLDFESDQGIAANLPGWTPYAHGQALYQSRYLSDSGRLFFNSTDALVPPDSNGTGDVYEYEPPGTGDCSTASSLFVGSSGGCLGLISSGTSKEESGFEDASEDGSDVFFESTARLATTDTDASRDVYDARIGGGFAESQSPPACEGDACQSPVAAPEDPTPSSLTYHGPGNQPSPTPATVKSKPKAKPLTRAQKLAKALKACKRDRSKRTRNKCTQSARKRYAPAKTGRATTKRKGR